MTYTLPNGNQTRPLDRPTPPPCPHCATIGGLAAATKAALAEIRDHIRQLQPQPDLPVAVIGPASRTRKPRRATGSKLTDREREVIEYIAQGFANAAIGERMFLSEDTIKTHLRRAYRKLGANDRAHAVAIAYQTGILGGDR